MNEQFDNILEKRIRELGYRSLFLTDLEVTDKEIWNFGANEQELKIIAYSEKTSDFSRFLTVELLRHYDVKINSKYHSLIAKSYAYALSNSATDNPHFFGVVGNLWGLLYEEDDLGKLGSFYVSLGDKAVLSLSNLLDNKNDKIFYDGSEEATIGNSYQYRVKDFAAFYISKIKNIPITFYQDFDQRDAEIERLKEILANE
ncbi:hypothetical protein [Kordia antarctica]|nr:hypothetical protein [Kordia antarctica]